jgi:hypothetical protein
MDFLLVRSWFASPFQSSSNCTHDLLYAPRYEFLRNPQDQILEVPQEVANGLSGATQQ